MAPQPGQSACQHQRLKETNNLRKTQPLPNSYSVNTWALKDQTVFEGACACCSTLVIAATLDWSTQAGHCYLQDQGAEAQIRITCSKRELSSICSCPV